MRKNGGILGRRNDPTGLRASGVWKWDEYISQSLYGQFPKYTTGYDFTYLMNTQAEWNGVFTGSLLSGGLGSSFLSANGTMYFILIPSTSFPYSNTFVQRYDLSTPYNISTRVYAGDNNRINVASQLGSYNVAFINGIAGAEAYLNAITFSDDGSKMYLGSGSNGYRVYEYDLSTPWNVATSTYNTFITANTTGVAGGTLRDISWKPDGTKLFITFRNIITPYDVSNPYSISSATVDLPNVHFTTQESSNTIATFFKSDGTEMYIAANNSNFSSKVVKYDLALPWVPSSANPVDEIAVGSQDPYLRGGLTLSEDGTKLIITARSFTSTYTLKTPWTINAAPTFYGNTSISADGIFFRPDGRRFYAIGRFTGDTACYQYDHSVPYDLRTRVSSGGSVYSWSNLLGSISGLNVTDCFFKPDGTRMYVSVDGVGVQGRVYQLNINQEWNVSGTNLSLSTSASPGQSVSTTGLYFSSDGTKMYMLCSTNDRVYQYNLVTPWNISGVTYANKSKSVAPQTLQPTDIHFNQNGTKMFILGFDNFGGSFVYKIYQYTLSTAWDVSTALYDFVRYSLPMASDQDFIDEQNPLTYGMTMSDDGTKLFVADFNNTKVYQYTLR